MPTLTVLGVPVAVLRREEALAEVERLIDAPGTARLCYVNAHSVNMAQSHVEYRDAIGRMELVLNDGSGMAIAARAQGRSFPDNLNGSDFTPEVLRIAARRGLGVFFLGGKPGVSEMAANRFAELVPGLRVVGSRRGHFPFSEADDVADEIRATGADVLVTAMGNPDQELFLANHAERTGVKLATGVGGLFDIITERYPRAPLWMRRAGIEWVHRLRLEPRRMWRRYLLGNPLFLARVFAERVRTLLGRRTAS